MYPRTYFQIVGVGKNYKAHVAELAAGDNPLVRDTGARVVPNLVCFTHAVLAKSWRSGKTTQMR